MKEPSWRHFAADFVCASDALLNDPDRIAVLLRESLKALSERCVWTCHRFEPHGVSVVALANTMRVAVHTWPEHRRATIDVWTSDCDAKSAIEMCGRSFGGT